MHNCNYDTHDVNTDKHVNAFIDLNGIPYLLAEYLDRNSFQQVDRSYIKSEVNVDQHDAMRAVVDISIDDIGKRASDGLPAIVGNNSKQRKLLKLLSINRNNLDGQLGTLKRGIVVRVNYQLENYRTRQVIRSMTEDFRINDRNYFLDINPRNVDDNAIITNFCNTMVSTINEFTHGRDPMMMRVTSVQLFYEMVQHNHRMPRLKQSWTGDPHYPVDYGVDGTYYYHHKKMQNHHHMPGCDDYGYGNEHVSMISPNKWTSFNRFYHFDNSCSDIVLHFQEVYDNMTKIALLPCGTVHVNRTFMINPGHRIIFKFCIWKNDLTVVTDTTQIAQYLRVPLDNGYHPMRPDNNHNCDCDHDEDYDKILDLLEEGHKMDHEQNKIISDLNSTVSELSEMVNNLMNSNDPDGECCEECDAEHDRLEDMIDAIPDVKPISNQTILDIVEANSKVDI